MDPVDLVPIAPRKPILTAPVLVIALKSNSMAQTDVNPANTKLNMETRCIAGNVQLIVMVIEILY